MRLYVYVLEAKELKFSDSYAKIQVGKLEAKTRIVKNTTSPVWNEEFVFRVNDVEEEVCVSVFHCVDGSGLLLGSRELMGRVKIPISSIVNDDNQTLPPSWLSLRRTSKATKYVHEDQGRILLTVSLHGKYHESSSVHLLSPHSDIDSGIVKSPKGTSHYGTPKTEEFSKLYGTPSDYEDSIEDSAPNFEEAIETLQLRDSEREMPGNLRGGILLDRIYAVRPCDLNAFLFAPDCQFMKDLANLQGTTNREEGPWIWKIGDQSQLKRVVSYTKAATKMVKAVKATEYQTFIKANEKEFAVLVDVSTPDVPYGGTFNVQLLYKIMLGSQQASSEESARLTISWGINFHKSVIMKGHRVSAHGEGWVLTIALIEGTNLASLDSMELPDPYVVFACNGKVKTSSVLLQTCDPQ